MMSAERDAEVKLAYEELAEIVRMEEMVDGRKKAEVVHIVTNNEKVRWDVIARHERNTAGFLDPRWKYHAINKLINPLLFPNGGDRSSANHCASNAGTMPNAAKYRNRKHEVLLGVVKQHAETSAASSLAEESAINSCMDHVLQDWHIAKASNITGLRQLVKIVTERVRRVRRDGNRNIDIFEFVGETGHLVDWDAMEQTTTTVATFQSSSSAVSHFDAQMADAVRMNPGALALYLQGEQERQRTEQEKQRTEQEKQKTEQARLKSESETEQARLKSESETEQARLKFENETEQARLKFDNETEQARLKLENETEQARLVVEQERQRTEQNWMNFETEKARLMIAEKQIELTKLTSTHHGKRALAAANGEPTPIPASAPKRARTVPKGECQLDAAADIRGQWPVACGAVGLKHMTLLSDRCDATERAAIAARTIQLADDFAARRGATVLPSENAFLQTMRTVTADTVLAFFRCAARDTRMFVNDARRTSIATTVGDDGEDGRAAAAPTAVPLTDNIAAEAEPTEEEAPPAGDIVVTEPTEEDRRTAAAPPAIQSSAGDIVTEPTEEDRRTAAALPATRSLMGDIMALVAMGRRAAAIQPSTDNILASVTHRAGASGVQPQSLYAMDMNRWFPSVSNRVHAFQWLVEDGVQPLPMILQYAAEVQAETTRRMQFKPLGTIRRVDIQTMGVSFDLRFWSTDQGTTNRLGRSFPVLTYERELQITVQAAVAAVLLRRRQDLPESGLVVPLVFVRDPVLMATMRQALALPRPGNDCKWMGLLGTAYL